MTTVHLVYEDQGEGFCEALAAATGHLPDIKSWAQAHWPNKRIAVQVVTITEVSTDLGERARAYLKEREVASQAILAANRQLLVQFKDNP